MTEVREARVEFPVLDTMRAVASFAVLLTHCAFNSGAYDDWGFVGPAFARMDVGVAVFFVLSGFLLSRHWFGEAAAGRRRPAPGRYLVKRFLRVVPAYLVVAVVALLLVPQDDPVGFGGWVHTLTLTSIYVDDSLPQGITQTWSLATEAAFYVALPLVMLLVVGRAGRLDGRRVGLLMVVALVVNLWWLLGLSGRIGSGQPNQWLPAFLTWFAVGIGLAWLQVAGSRAGAGPWTVRCRRVARTLGAAPGVCWAAVAGLLLIAGTSVAGPTLLVPATESEAVTKNLIYALIAGLLVIPGIWSDPTSRYHRVLAHPRLRHLGHISYSVFLVHIPLLTLIMTWTGYELFTGHLVQILALTSLLSLVTAELLYRYVELPAMRLKDRRPFRGRPTATPNPVHKATTTR